MLNLHVQYWEQCDLCGYTIHIAQNEAEDYEPRPCPACDGGKPQIFEYKKEDGLKEYKLGLEEGGLMEDPELHIEHIRTVTARNLVEAKQKWAEITGHSLDRYWDREKQTYYGWRVVQV